MNRREAEFANERAVEAFARDDVETVIRESRNAARIYQSIGDTDMQFRSLIAWPVYVYGRNQEAALRFLEEAERLLPALEGESLEPLHQLDSFRQSPVSGLSALPDDPYAQRVTELQRIRQILDASCEQMPS